MQQFIHVCIYKEDHTSSFAVCPQHSNKQEILQKLRHFYCAHFVFSCARHTRFRIYNAMFKDIRPAIKEYGFNLVQNRSTTYCYPCLYAG